MKSSTDIFKHGTNDEIYNYLLNLKDLKKAINNIYNL